MSVVSNLVMLSPDEIIGHLQKNFAWTVVEHDGQYLTVEDLEEFFSNRSTCFKDISDGIFYVRVYMKNVMYSMLYTDQTKFLVE